MELDEVKKKAEKKIEWNNKWKNHLEENKLALLFLNDELLEAFFAKYNLFDISASLKMWNYKNSSTTFAEIIMLDDNGHMLSMILYKTFWHIKIIYESDFKEIKVFDDNPVFQVLFRFPWEEVSKDIN